MVYTLTLNPSLDHIVNVPDFKYGEVNRSSDEVFYPGGKGINVSIILHRLGIQTKALGFKAGFTGGILEEMLDYCGISHDLITLKSGNTRINLKLKTRTETEINGKGADIPYESLETLFKKLEELNDKDILVMAGSIPNSISDNIYGEIAEKIVAKNVKFVIDTTGEAFKKTLRFKPFLIKPNLPELSELFGSEAVDRKTIVERAYSLREEGARNVLISMSEKGALLIDETGKFHEISAPKGRLINSTGSGDSMVAGFIAGRIMNYDYENSLKLGVAAGSTSAFKEWLAEKEDVWSLYKKL